MTRYSNKKPKQRKSIKRRRRMRGGTTDENNNPQTPSLPPNISTSPLNSNPSSVKSAPGPQRPQKPNPEKKFNFDIPKTAPKTAPSAIDRQKIQKLDLESKTVIHELQKSLQSIRSGLDNNNDSLETKTANFKKRLSDIVAQLQKLEAESKEKEVISQQIQQDRDRLMQEKEATKLEIQELQKRVKDQEVIVKNLTDKSVSTSEDKQKIQDLLTKNAELSALLANKTTDLKKLQGKVGVNNNEIVMQIKQLQAIKDSLNNVETKVKNQSNQIDSGFGQFDKEVGMLEGIYDTVSSSLSGITNVFNFGYQQGGSKSRRKAVKKLKLFKFKKSDLKRIATKWGVKYCKDSKTSYLVCLTIILAFKTKPKKFTKSRMMTLAKILGIKFDKKVKVSSLKSAISKKTKRFNIKDII